jgi:Tol biopolymer transport system component
MTRTTAAIVSTLTLALTFPACDAGEQRVVLGGTIDLSATAADMTESATVRRVWGAAGDYANPSPDGRYVAFVDWTTGDVAMHEVSTGLDRHLTEKGTWTENGGWAEEPLFSPDGRQVAYSFGNVRVPNANFQYELRVVTLGDTTQRIVHALTPRDSWIVPLDWSAAGGILVEICRGPDRDRVTELAVVHPTSGAVRVLRTIARAADNLHEAAFSPDARFVVYRQGKNLRMIGTDGSGDRSLGVEIRWLLGWAPNGRGVLVHASARSTTGIWLVPLSNSRQAGEPVLVRGGMAAFVPAGLAGDHYYYRVPVEAPRVYVTSVEIPSGRTLAPPMAVTSPVEGRGTGPSWSPDGRSLAYSVFDFSERTQRIMVRDLNGDAVRELATVAGTLARTAWAPDGRAVYAIEGGSVVRIDVRTGVVGEPVEYGGRGATIAPDGRLVYARNAPERDDLASGLFVRDLATGAERQLYDGPAATHALGISPDGRDLAVVLHTAAPRASRLVIVPLAGGAMREVARAEYPMEFNASAVGSVNWTPDGRTILVRAWSQDPEVSQILAVPAAGGQPVPVMRASGRNHTFHPDGRRMAYSAGESRDELWVLDDLSPQR